MWRSGRRTASPVRGATTSAAAATDTKFTSADQLNKAIFAAMKAKKTVSYRATGTVEGKPEQAINSTGALEYGADGVSATINNKSEGKDQIVTITPKGIYLKLGAETGDPAKPWVKITPGGEDIFSKLMGAVVSAVQTQADLSKQLENIKSGGTITSTGEDTVNGEKVTKYAVSVDVKKVARPRPTLGQEGHGSPGQGGREHLGAGALRQGRPAGAPGGHPDAAGGQAELHQRLLRLGRARRDHRAQGRRGRRGAEAARPQLIQIMESRRVPSPGSAALRLYRPPQGENHAHHPARLGEPARADRLHERTTSRSDRAGAAEGGQRPGAGDQAQRGHPGQEVGQRAELLEVKGREGGPSHTRAEGILRADGGDRVSRKVEAHGDTGLELPEGIFFKSAEAEGKPWERLDLANKESATNLVAVRGLVAMNDPTRTAEVLQLGGKIDSAAQEEMSNVQTVKYQVSVDLAKARDLSEDPITKAMLKTRTAKERSTAVHEIWLTADHVPVRWKVTELAKDGKGEIVDSVYTDWGRTFDLAPPPADQIQK